MTAVGRGQKGKALWVAGLGGWYFTFNYVYLPIYCYLFNGQLMGNALFQIFKVADDYLLRFGRLGCAKLPNKRLRKLGELGLDSFVRLC